MRIFVIIFTFSSIFAAIACGKLLADRVGVLRTTRAHSGIGCHQHPRGGGGRVVQTRMPDRSPRTIADTENADFACRISLSHRRSRDCRHSQGELGHVRIVSRIDTYATNGFLCSLLSCRVFILVIFFCLIYQSNMFPASFTSLFVFTPVFTSWYLSPLISPTLTPFSQSFRQALPRVSTQL